MSSVPNHYNADDRVRWERYAAALRAYGAGQGPHPGNPPAGYREVFKLSQRYAPVPEDYPTPTPAPSQQVPPPGLAGVNMSDTAFNALLAHTAAVNAQFAALQSKVLSDSRRSTALRSYGGRGSGGGPSHGRRGLRLVDRVSTRLSDTTDAGSFKRKRGHRGGRGRDRKRRGDKAAGGPATTDTGGPAVDSVQTDGDVAVAANVEATAQGPVAAPQEPDVTDHDFQMELEQYGEGDDALAY
ncbi:hypothetical protein OH76DRAFT_1419385 [Lentinus brumalis]|uniref:Uncharacterized protein n=1 Tax=Lentinus brumalis TaxID=2498619 RepID=A0A371D5E4_9APHY|nr:hypothetical protein OH76DRAFT_1419385 [Polyporus brumalis]